MKLAKTSFIISRNICFSDEFADEIIKKLEEDEENEFEEDEDEEYEDEEDESKEDEEKN